MKMNSKSASWYGINEICYALKYYSDVVKDILEEETDVNTNTCLAILEEDIQDLIRECERKLKVSEREVDEAEELSIENRSATVIDELTRILQN